MFGLFSKSPVRKRSKSRERNVINYDKPSVAPVHKHRSSKRGAATLPPSGYGSATHLPPNTREHMREHVVEGDAHTQREHHRELYREHMLSDSNNNQLDALDLNTSGYSTGSSHRQRQMVLSAEDVQEQRARQKLRGRHESGTASEERKEIFRSAHSRAGLNTVHTQRILRKTTTLNTQHKLNPEDDELLRERLIRWAQKSTEGYSGITVIDLTSSWRDGQAFNAILHRNRPELLDYEKTLDMSSFDRLDSVFHLYEQVGVQRTISPGQVLGPQQDESALFQYIYSVYQRFPHPPSRNPLAEQQLRARLSNYRQRAQLLLRWIQEHHSRLQRRELPNLIEQVRALQSAHESFITQDLPPKATEKSRLASLYTELSHYAQQLHVHLPHELSTDHIDIWWQRLQAAIAEYSDVLASELARLLRLQQLADQLQREIREVDLSLTDLERQVTEEAHRVRTLDPLTGEFHIERIEHGLRVIGDCIRELYRKCDQLQSGGYHAVDSLKVQIDDLQERWNNLRARFDQDLVRVLAHRRQEALRRPLTEEELIAKYESFRQLADDFKWLNAELEFWAKQRPSLPLEQLKARLNQLRERRRQIIKFGQTDLQRAEQRANEHTGEERIIYDRMLARAHDAYERLVDLSAKKVDEFEACAHLLSKLLEQLEWLRSAQEALIRSDWSDEHLDVDAIEARLQQLNTQLEVRRSDWRTLHEQLQLASGKHSSAAAALLRPAAARLQAATTFLCNLSRCSASQASHWRENSVFFERAHSLQQWLKETEQKLQELLTIQVNSIDHGETLLGEMATIRQEINSKQAEFNALIAAAANVVPITGRSRPPHGQLVKVKALCSLQLSTIANASSTVDVTGDLLLAGTDLIASPAAQAAAAADVSTSAGDTIAAQAAQLSQVHCEQVCVLLDNRGQRPGYWLIRRDSDMQQLLSASVCFSMQPPDQDAAQLAQKLREWFERIVQLWSHVHHRLRVELIRATLELVKGWDYDTYINMPVDQRNAVLNALQADIDKLASEAPPNDPDVRQLQNELDELRRKFAEWDKRRAAQLAAMQLAERLREFEGLCQPLLDDLRQLLRLLRERCEQPIARNMVAHAQLVSLHRDLEASIQRQHTKYEVCKKSFLLLPSLDASVFPQDLPDCAGTWAEAQKIWTELRDLSALYNERLAQEQQAINAFDACQKSLAEIEQRLSSGAELSSEQWSRVPAQLRELHSKMQNHQPHWDQWTGSSASAFERLRTIVVKTRAHASGHTHNDLHELREQLDQMAVQWSQLATCLKHLQARLDSFQYREQRLSSDLKNLRAHSALNRPLAAETSALQKQLQELRAFNREQMQPMVGRLKELRFVEQECNNAVHNHGQLSRLQAILVEVHRRTEATENAWSELQASYEERERRLESALQLAEQFWKNVAQFQAKLKQLGEKIAQLSHPALESSAIRDQLIQLAQIQQTLAGECEQELASIVDLCNRLCELCSEQAASGPRKTVDELRAQLAKLRSAADRAEQLLQAALRRAEQFDQLRQQLLDLLKTVELQIAHFGPIPTQADQIRQQLSEVQSVRAQLDANVPQLQQLNELGNQIVAGRSDGKAIREKLREVNQRWSDAMDALAERENQLEQALLRLGKFELALNELLNWLTGAEQRLAERPARFADVDILAQQLAQHRQLQAEIRQRAASVRQLNEAGNAIIAGRSDSQAALSLQQMNDRWRALCESADTKADQLNRLHQLATDLHARLQKKLGLITKHERQFADWPQLAGLSDNAREQLQRFDRIQQQIDSIASSVRMLGEQLDNQLENAEALDVPNFTRDLASMRTRWEELLNRANDKGIKLRNQLELTLQLERLVRDLSRTLDEIESRLNAQPQISRLLDPLKDQQEQTGALNDRLQAERERLQDLIQLGERICEICAKSDAKKIASAINAIQEKHEKLGCALNERLRTIAAVLKQVEEFQQAYDDFGIWIEQAREHLMQPLPSGGEAEILKQALSKQKEFQRQLVSKKIDFENVMTMGKQLLAEAPKNEIPIIQAMLDDLRRRWNSLFSDSIRRQRKLEEALLVNGQLREALRSLLDWLEQTLASISLDRLYGDLDTVLKLQEQHRTLLEEMKIKQRTLATLKKNAAALTGSPARSANIDPVLDAQLAELEQRWERLEQLAARKTAILADAEKEAIQLGESVHRLLEWLSESEVRLRFSGPPPEDEQSITRLQLSHASFVRQMAIEERAKNDCIAHAERILQKCHPDAESMLQHWITIVQARWDELASWSKQWTERLSELKNGLANVSQSIEQLMTWLSGAETSLLAANCKTISEPEALQQLLSEHRIFMEEMEEKRVDFERIVRMFAIGDGLTSGQLNGRSPVPPANQSALGSATSYADLAYATSSRRGARGSRRWKGSTPNLTTGGELDIDASDVRNGRVRELIEKWRSVSQLSVNRLSSLQERMDLAHDSERLRNFDFEDWKQRFSNWIKSQRLRASDFYRKLDIDGLGAVSYEQFINGFISSKFPTNRLEMEKVAPLFDLNGDLLIEQKEFLETLRVEQPISGRDDEYIMNELQKQVSRCTCLNRFKVYQVGEGKYRFGSSQKLHMLRILRSTIMVRVGGGWITLDEFLDKNDPCRARGRTNFDLGDLSADFDDLISNMEYATRQFEESAKTTIEGPQFSADGPVSKVREFRKYHKITTTNTSSFHE